jgi:hypothetical protein
MVSIYIIVVAAISLLSAIFAPETAMSPLRGEGVKIEETQRAEARNTVSVAE